MYFSVGRTDVVAREHTAVREVFILVTSVAGYFDGKFVPSNSTIAATVSARFLRTALSYAVRRYDGRVYREERGRALTRNRKGAVGGISRMSEES